MKPDDCIRLTHVAEALGHAVRFIQGRSRGDLDSDPMLTFAYTGGGMVPREQLEGARTTVFGDMRLLPGLLDAAARNGR